MPKNIAYLRGSALDQDLEKNKADVANEKILVKSSLCKKRFLAKLLRTILKAAQF